MTREERVIPVTLLTVGDEVRFPTFGQERIFTVKSVTNIEDDVTVVDLGGGWCYWLKSDYEVPVLYETGHSDQANAIRQQ